MIPDEKRIERIGGRGIATDLNRSGLIGRHLPFHSPPNPNEATFNHETSEQTQGVADLEGCAIRSHGHRLPLRRTWAEDNPRAKTESTTTMFYLTTTTMY